MYMTKKELATVLGCSLRTIERKVTEMERSGLYPNAVMQVGRVRASREDFEDFLLRQRRMKWNKNQTEKRLQNGS